MSGTLTATESCPPVTRSSTLTARGNTSVSGPGQKRSARRAAARHLACPTVQKARTIEVHDQRVRGRATFEREDLLYRRRVLRVGTEPVYGSVGKATSSPPRSACTAASSSAVSP